MLVACGPAPGTKVADARAPSPNSAERAYVPPPAVRGLGRADFGRIILNGAAAPLARVRLATPAGAALFATADRSGAWRMVIAAAPEVRLYGLAMANGGRWLQSEGYIAVTPQGAAAQLRAGSGAAELGGGSGLAILTADFDRKGGAVVSGHAPAGAAVQVLADGKAAGAARADAAGRFTAALAEPLKPGAHELEAVAGAARARADLAVSPAAPVSPPPFRASRLGDAWRIDWMTPGGGLQTTVLFGAAPA